jgi:hypothetical protein
VEFASDSETSSFARFAMRVTSLSVSDMI